MAILTSCFDEADQRRREEMHKQRLLMEKELCEKARHDAEEYLRRHPNYDYGALQEQGGLNLSSQQKAASPSSDPKYDNPVLLLL